MNPCSALLVAAFALPAAARRGNRLRHHRLENDRRQSPGLRLRLRRPEDSRRHLPRQPGADRRRQGQLRAGRRSVAVLARLPPGRPDHPAGQSARRRDRLQRKHLDPVQGNRHPPLRDEKRNVLVYLAISRKIIEGAPANAISDRAGSALGNQATVKTALREVMAYITKDGSEIRELLHPSQHPVRQQSLAEAVIPTGSCTQLHRHQVTEEIYHVTRGCGLMTLGEKPSLRSRWRQHRHPPGTPHCVENIGSGSAAHPLLLCSGLFTRRHDPALSPGTARRALRTNE